LNVDLLKPLFQLIDVGFIAPGLNGNTFSIIKNVSLKVGKGECVAIIGRSGSGKTALSRLLCGLLDASAGNILIEGRRIEELKKRGELQKTIGYLFSDPENQIVYPVVEDDVAFGPANLGFPPDEIKKRVAESLKTVGLEGYEKKPVSLLSSGEMKKVALAGVLAMGPRVIVLDEPFLMLDPRGVLEMAGILKRLSNKGITLVSAISSLEEAGYSDRVFILNNGEVILEGKLKDILSERRIIEDAGLSLPKITQLIYLLREKGLQIPVDVLDIEKISEFLLDQGFSGRK
jgi:energy-coupling factor transport system ATP-binding protein